MIFSSLRAAVTGSICAAGLRAVEKSAFAVPRESGAGAGEVSITATLSLRDLTGMRGPGSLPKRGSIVFTSSDSPRVCAFVTLANAHRRTQKDRQIVPAAAEWW